VEQKTLFDTDTARNFANRDAARVLRFVVGTDDDAFKNLDALFVSFFDFLVYSHGVTAANVDDLRFFLLVIDFLN
jgi:hypothetical protein